MKKRSADLGAVVGAKERSWLRNSVPRRSGLPEKVLVELKACSRQLTKPKLVSRAAVVLTHTPSSESENTDAQ